MFSEFALRANSCRHMSRSVTAEKEGSQLTHTMEARVAADRVKRWLDLSPSYTRQPQAFYKSQ